MIKYRIIHIVATLLASVMMFTGFSIRVNAESHIPLNNVNIFPPMIHNITWPFAVYDEPSFSYEPITVFSPQTVYVHTMMDNGWALIGTHIGNKWTYVKANSGEVTHNLNDFMAKYGTNISLYYENMETGFTYRYNEDRSFYSASVIKAPYVLYLYNLADNGEIDLSAGTTYVEQNHRGGAGVIKYMKYGTTLSISDLLGYAITNSDNVAFRLLMGDYGTDGFKQFILNTGGKTDTLYNLTNAYINANDAAFYAKEIYDYIELPGVNNETFKRDLIANPSGYIESDFPTANKYGLWDNAQHDMAIVYADSPYILVILTDMGTSDDNGASEESKAVFKTISDKFSEINNIFS